MKASRKLSRRSFAASVLGGVVIGGGATSLLVGRAHAQTMPYSGVTDCDAGARHDAPGYGTGVRNQYTDSDTGANADPRCRGHGPGPGANTGRYDNAVQPRTGCSDSDGGNNADPGGRGQRCNGQTPYPRNYTPQNYRHCSDSDSGNGADLMGAGTHC